MGPNNWRPKRDVPQELLMGCVDMLPLVGGGRACGRVGWRVVLGGRSFWDFGPRRYARAPAYASRIRRCNAGLRTQLRHARCAVESLQLQARPRGRLGTRLRRARCAIKAFVAPEDPSPHAAAMEAGHGVTLVYDRLSGERETTHGRPETARVPDVRQISG